MTDILFETLKGKAGHLGIITLNRPTQLNAITLDMTCVLEKRLAVWAADDTLLAVLIRGKGRAFCAGGDLRQLYDASLSHQSNAADFFVHEYGFNLEIANFAKPYIAWCHGITMGGGVGLGFHGSHILATPSTQFAMPETQIGFFPDVGARYLLHQCPGKIGVYLALTGARLQAEDLHYCGLVNSVQPETGCDALIENCLQHLSCDTEKNRTWLNQTLTTPRPTHSRLALLQNEIDVLFNHKTLSDIIQTVKQSQTEFARETLALLEHASPSSLHLTFDLMKDSENFSLAHILKQDLTAAKARITHPDLLEGIRAQVIDKDKSPHWQHSEQVTG